MIRVFTSPTQQIGKEGEEQAVTFLKGQKFDIVGRNVSVQFGEIDIIARKEAITYFFEVKTVRQGSAVFPAENLNRKKIVKFLHAVHTYRSAHRISKYRVQGIIVLQNRDGTYTVEAIDLF